MQTNKEILRKLNKHKPVWYSLGMQYEKPSEAVRYFCTPMGAQIFASLGVDGIHYITLPSQGDTVLMVDPMPSDDRYVIPVAENLADFMCLIYTLEGTQLLDRTLCPDEAKWKEHLTLHLAAGDDRRKAELNELSHLFDVRPISDPYRYMCALADRFAYDKIEYSHEYYETLGLTQSVHESDDFVSVTIRYVDRKGKKS